MSTVLWWLFVAVCFMFDFIFVRKFFMFTLFSYCSHLYAYLLMRCATCASVSPIWSLNWLLVIMSVNFKYFSSLTNIQVYTSFTMLSFSGLLLFAKIALHSLLFSCFLLFDAGNFHPDFILLYQTLAHVFIWWKYKVPTIHKYI